MIDELVEKLAILLQGKIPDKINTAKATDQREEKLADLLNQLFIYLQEIDGFIVPLSQGKLDEIKLPQPKNLIGSPFKELHSRLLHLTWQAEQVASGDYSQRVDFMGDFSEAFNFMIASLDKKEKELKGKIEQLEEALSHIEKLEGILPICSNCKRIMLEGANPREQESWVAMESYIGKRAEVQFSHGICPECKQKLYPHL